jgi:CHASE2 domain-containing sensor protein
VSDENEDGHGNSPAAWVAVVIMLVGFAGGTLAFWFDQPTLVFVSVGVVVLGLIAGGVLAKLGYGVKGPRYAPKSHS